MILGMKDQNIIDYLFFLCITKKRVKNNTEILRCCVTGTGIPLDTAGSHHTLTRGKISNTKAKKGSK